MYQLIFSFFFFSIAIKLISRAEETKTLYDFSVTNIDGIVESLDKYNGQVVLIVNVASTWALTKINYKQLNDLYAKYSSKGLAIAAFPSNSFQEEQGNNEEIKKFAQKNGVQFDIYGKIEVNGENASPLYKWLKSEQGSTLTDDIKWNFTKFLVDKNGKAIKRYESYVQPKDIEKDIKAQL
jgi:glutathione peroxidase-family protein